MDEKEKTYLAISPKEKDFRLLIVDKLLTEMTPAERLVLLKEMFLAAAKNHNDEATCVLIGMIGKEYDWKERKIADETDKHYGNANIRANANFCGYLENVYWDLPDKIKTGEERRISYPYEHYPVYGPTLLKTKVQIIKVCIGHWAGYSYGRKYFEDVDEQSLKIFNFLVDAYSGRGKCYVSIEEKEEILKLFREYTDSYFTPKIAEKWLKQPNVPEEIMKIFIIARARNGGIALIERDMKNAELLKPFDAENRSEAALEFHKKFCEELAIIDEKVRELIKEFLDGPCDKAERIDVSYDFYDKFRDRWFATNLYIYFKKNYLSHWSLVQEILQNIHDYLSKLEKGRHVKIRFTLLDGDVESVRGFSERSVYL